MNPQERRTSSRKTFRHLAYLSLPSDNGGIVLDASEGGLRFHSIGPIETSGPIEFRFAIDSATRISATGEVAWKDSSGKTGGLRFTDLSDEARQQLRLWASQSKVLATPRPAIESVLDIIDLPGIEKKTAGDSPRSPIAMQAGELGLLAASTVTSAALAIIERLEGVVPAAVAAAVTPSATAPVPIKVAVTPVATASVPVAVEFIPAVTAPAATSDTVSSDLASTPAVDVIANEAAETVAVAVAPSPEPPSEPVVPAAASAPVAETFPAPRTQNPPYSSNAMAARAREAISTSKSKRSSSPILASALPPRHQSPVPMFGSQANQFSMFGMNRRPAGKSSASFNRTPVPIQNPVGAVILTIALAFIVSVGVFSCLFQTRAGDAVVHWGQAIWGISNPQEISEVPSAPAVAPDPSSPSQSR
jgi:hypothetical protein